MNISERHEEILEAIWIASERKEFSTESIKKECVIDFVEVDLSQIESHGFILRDQHKILFSAQGKKYAEKIIRRQRLAKVLLSSILKIRNAQMEELACKIEHTLLPEVEESICTLLGHPEVCPNGESIPRGRCCGNKVEKLDRVIRSLKELAPGESGKIIYIKPDNHEQLHRLIAFGLNPGIVIAVHMNFPAFCIKFGNTELVLDAEIAGNIFVLKSRPLGE
ncbi:MAG: FeoA domain-containing protein [Oligoflexia bacterium]|nr:FeoA domain-containing protein [Oligoflexia bacterium]MBF0365821.1 FeoA domain-containing protein [Oligoflexia bacterium]